MKTICHALLDTCREKSTSKSVIVKRDRAWKTLTWDDYLGQVCLVAAGIQSLGAKPGDRLAILSNTRVEWAHVDIANLCVGGVTVPVYESSLPEELEFILQNSGATILICEGKKAVEKFKQISKTCPNVKHVVVIEPTEVSQISNLVQWSDFLKMASERLSKEPAALEKSISDLKVENLASIVYTSGTTGQPKGVMLAHEQIMSEVVEVFKVLEIQPTDRSLTFLPYAHVLGRVEHFAHILIGFTMGYAESIDRIRDNMMDIKPTFLVAVPRIFEKIYAGIISQADISPAKKMVFQWALKVGKQVSACRVENRDLPITVQLEYQLARKMVFDKLSEKLGGHLRFALCGGAPLSAEISKFFHASNLLILEGYGLTETTAAVFVNSPYGYRFGTVGKPIGDVEVKIATDGEILVRSKKVMKGYYNNPEATKEVLSSDGWFATGDIGEVNTEGFLRITDRKKDLIKTAGGKYVAPQKLENLLKLSKYVSNVLIHGDRRKYIVALLTPNFSEVEKYAKDQSVKFENRKQLIHEAKVRELMRGVVADTNHKLASFESIKNFDLLDHDFTVENGELTPSLKVKRKFCDQKYQTEISKLYGEEGAAI